MMEGEWKGNGRPTYKGRDERGKREREDPPVITVIRAASIVTGCDTNECANLKNPDAPLI